MYSRSNWFNLIFIGAALLVCGCHSPKANPKDPKAAAAEDLKKKYKKEKTFIQLHLETAKNASGATPVPVLRDKPVFFMVENKAFLDWRNITDANVVEYLEGFGIQLQFDEHGAFVLDTITTANRNKHILILAESPEKRWLAAPLIMQRNSSGALAFTPDATREEAEKLVIGIKNVVTQVKRQGGY